MSRAEYMRAYRAKRKSVDLTTTPGKVEAAFDMVRVGIYVRELEEEVRHLKAELAKRPTPGITHATGGNATDRRAAQAQRDAILNRVNRGRKP